MVDKVTTIPRSKLGDRVGRLADDDMVRLRRAVMVFSGLAGLNARSADLGASPRSGGPDTERAFRSAAAPDERRR